MAKPENVNPSNFTVIKVLYNNGDFSVAYGVWTETDEKCLGMRWNGAGDEPGYPKVFGNPMWFIVDSSLQMAILKTLIGLDDSDNQAIIDSIKTDMNL